MLEPLVLIPGLNCTADLYAPQWPALATGRTILVADNRSDDSLAAIVARLLAAAPPRFALCGLSMGGYIAFEVMRQAPERVTRLALLDTSAKPATPESNVPREQMIALAEKGAFDNVTTLLWQRLVAPSRLTDDSLRLRVRQMGEEVGADGFVRQQRAIMGRPDSQARAQRDCGSDAGAGRRGRSDHARCRGTGNPGRHRPIRTSGDDP